MSKIKKYVQKDGTITYYFNAYLGLDPITGKKVRVTRRGFKSGREAESELAKLRYEFDQGLYQNQPQETYQAVYDLWMEVYKTTVKESTLNRITQVFRDHILPIFGKKKISKITSIDCQNFYNDLTRRFVKGNEMFNYARKCYQYAIVPLKLVKENPFYYIYIRPTKTEEKRGSKYQFMELEDLNLLLDMIKKDEDCMWYTYFRLLGYTGMRKSEALALTWQDIHFTDSAIRINKTLTRGVNNRLMVDSTKTDKSNRTVLLDKTTANILLDWRKQNKVLNFKSIVFPNKNGNYTVPSKPNKILDRVIKKNNLKKVTVHSLRHSHCCHLFDAGVGLKEVQDRLGHAYAGTTLNIYNHVTEFRKKKTLIKFEEYIGS